MKKHIFRIFILALLILPTTINAERVQQYLVCLGDNGLFNVSFDPARVNDPEFLRKISNISVIQTKISGNGGRYEAENGDVVDLDLFEARSVASKCFIDKNGDIVTCPTNVSSMDQMYSVYLNQCSKSEEEKGACATKRSNVKNDSVAFTLNESNGTFKLQLDTRYTVTVNGKNVNKNFADEVTVKYYIAKAQSTDKAGEYTKYDLKASGNKWTVNNIPSSSALSPMFIVFEMYEKSSNGCNGFYIGDLAIQIPVAADYDVDNPAIKSGTREYNKCSEIKKYEPTFTDKKGKTVKVIPADKNNSSRIAFNDAKRKFFPECYSETKKIKFGRKATLYNELSINLEEFKKAYNVNQEFADKAEKVAISKAECISPNSSITASDGGGGSYWAYSCYEYYESNVDQPKLVKAGSGFNYEVTFTIHRACTMGKKTTVPAPPPKCQPPRYEWKCSWPGGSGSDMGPNDSLDSCVYSCDGGKYTQECVNKCYSESYNTTRGRNLDFIDKLSSNTAKKSNIEFMYTVTGKDRDTSKPCVTEKNNPGFRYDVGNGSGPCMSNWCTNNGGSCEIIEIIEPDPCVDDPPCYYYSGMSSAKSQFDEAQSAMDSDIPVGNYKFTITDSYLDNGTFKFVVNSGNGDQNLSLNVIPGSMETVKVETASADLGAWGDAHCGGTITNHVEYNSYKEVQRSVTVQLPYSYIDKVTGQVAYKSGKVAFDNRLNPLKKYKGDDYYYFTADPKLEKERRKYYTDIHSDNLYVAFDENKNPQLNFNKDTDKYNIRVDGSGLGNANFNPTVNCYYGVYNLFRRCPDCPNEPCDPTKEICDGNIQYIFRPIELTDVFPNDREPRFNWSCKANLKSWYKQNPYGTDVAPVLLTKEIEEKGDRIYNRGEGEIEYRFLLDSDSISAIKQYNADIKNGTLENVETTDFNQDGNRNYLDYNLTCYKNSQNKVVCKSAFLDNTSYVRYGNGYNSTQRESIIGCNNAKDSGSACDTSLTLHSGDMCTKSYGTTQTPPDPDCKDIIERVE